MPLVSIIVPSYDHARFIPACIESVLAQTQEDWDPIIVDHAGTDESIQRWKSYRASRIQVPANVPNPGTNDPQNRAVALASSTFFWNEIPWKLPQTSGGQK